LRAEQIQAAKNSMSSTVTTVSSSSVVVNNPVVEVKVDVQQLPPLLRAQPEAIRELPSLTLANKVPEQYADSGAKTSFSIPQDAFVHSDPTEVLTITAKQVNGQPLPNWVSFDPGTGTFKAQTPPNYVGELNVKLTARDSKGHEVTTIFNFSIGKKKDTLSEPQGRASLSSQLKSMSRDSTLPSGKTGALKPLPRADLNRVVRA